MGRALNLFAPLDQAAARFGDRGAVYLGERRLHDVDRVAGPGVAAGRLAAGSHEPGTRIALASENRPEIVELMFAVWAAECVVVPINYKLHPREMAQILDDSGAAAVFASPKIGPSLAAVAPTSRSRSSAAPSTNRRLRAAPSGVPSHRPGELAWLFYTSGTTGRSKGAMLSHRNLMAMTVAHLADFDSPDAELQPGARRPRCRTARASTSPPYVLRGARQVMPASGAFEPDGVPRSVRAPSRIAVRSWRRRWSRASSHTGRDRPPNLRTIVYGGGPMYVESLKKAMAAFGTDLRPDLRTGRVADDDHRPAPRRPRRARRRGARLGRLRPLRCRGRGARRRRRRRRAIGEIGEIVCRGDVVMSGYWNNPHATEDDAARRLAATPATWARSTSAAT